MSNNKQSGSLIAIVTMFFLYAMISFVTNLGAPIGVIWKNIFGNSNTVGTLGTLMNFTAYLFMGIPAGKMLVKYGYKKTALIGIATGFIGVFIQYLSGKFDPETAAVTGLVVYMLGAFISGFSVCMLNTVVNPMLNLLGGGGNRGNQLNMIGGTLNSLSGTLTPMLVGALIGTVTAQTKIADVQLVMFIAMTVFALAFCVLLFIPIQDPEMGKVTKDTVFEHSPWAFRHFVLGTIAIFVYVGVEIGLPQTLNFYITDTTDRGGGAGLLNAAAIGGFVAGTYWFLMLVGRMISASIADKVSSRMMMIVTTATGSVLIVLAMMLGKSSMVTMPVFTGSSFAMVQVPIAALLIVLCGLCTSVMWTSIFNLATEGLGKYSAAGAGIFMMMVVGGGILPFIQGFLADKAGYMLSYIIPLAAMLYMLYYALIGCKNVNEDIPVD